MSSELVISRQGWTRRSVFTAGAAAALSPASAEAQSSDLGEAERAAVVLHAAELVEERFYDRERALRAAAQLRARLASGAYSSMTDPEAFAHAITVEIRPILNDQHFRLEFSPPQPGAPAPTAPPPQEDADTALRAAYRPRNYDFRQTAILDGNVGYLRLFTFAPARMGEETAVAAMAFLANCDALVIDLRGNRGGYPDMGLLVASYLFDQPTHYATRYRRLGDRREEEWTRAELPGPRLSRQPVFIIVGRDTFSGGESLAYSLQALGRAKIVGERTQGGATGANLLPAGERFNVNVSDVNFTSPATGSNWEGVGVQPDIPAARRDALTIAHLAALAALQARAPDRIEYQWAQDLIRARAQPPHIEARRLRALAGAYGDRVLSWQEGELVYRRGENAIDTLVPLGADEFMLDGSITVRFRIAREGRTLVIEARYADGSSDRSVRAM